MSDHQPEQQDDEQAEADRQMELNTATEVHDLDFSRLRLARASLDNAFPQE